VLGTAHISETSSAQVRDVIREVRPDIIMVELDDERLGVLVDFGEQQSAKDDVLWYTDRTSLDPAPQYEGVSEQELLGALQSQPGQPITRAQMEQDARLLLGCGLFSQASPLPYPPPPDMGPMFVAMAGGKVVRQVNAMGPLVFRNLPQKVQPVARAEVRRDPDVPDSDWPKRLQEIASEALAREDAASVLSVCSRIRAHVKEAGLPEELVVNFSISDAEPRALVVTLALAGKTAHTLPRTGMESFGQRIRASDTSRGGSTTPTASVDVNLAGLGDSALREVLARPSAALQQAAASKLGMDKPGAEFRAALEEAVLGGADAVVLGDQPIATTRKRIADLLWEAARLKVAGIVLAATAVVGGSFAMEPQTLPVSHEAVALVAVLGAAGAVGYILSEPVREQAQVAGLSAEQLGSGVEQLLEQGVDVEAQGGSPERQVYEPALLEERDVYMSQLLMDLARGDSKPRPGFGLVACTNEEKVAPIRKMRYSVNFRSSDRPKTIVAVVGLAHVAGICKAWNL